MEPSFGHQPAIGHALNIRDDARQWRGNVFVFRRKFLRFRFQFGRGRFDTERIFTKPGNIDGI